MKIKLKFTDEHIALIKSLNFERIDIGQITKSFPQCNVETSIITERELFDKNLAELKDGVKTASPMSYVSEMSLWEVLEKYHINIDSIYGIDTFNLWGGTYIWEQMAYILGIYDRVIKGTEESPSGAQFPEEDMNHMKELAEFIITNLQNIMEILLQYCTEGIKPGVTYWCFDYQKIWYKEDNE